MDPLSNATVVTITAEALVAVVVALATFVAGYMRIRALQASNTDRITKLEKQAREGAGIAAKGLEAVDARVRDLERWQDREHGRRSRPRHPPGDSHG